jgi:hypothetical protein
MQTSAHRKRYARQGTPKRVRARQRRSARAFKLNILGLDHTEDAHGMPDGLITAIHYVGTPDKTAAMYAEMMRTMPPVASAGTGSTARLPFVSTALLGAFAGLTIFLGLPIARAQAATGAGQRAERVRDRTSRGRRIGALTLRRQLLAERLLVDRLGVSWDIAAAEACRLEHAISPVVEQRLADFLGSPQTCPHGHPIPCEDGTPVAS